MTVGDLYILEVEQELQGQKCLNVFTYRQGLNYVSLTGNTNAQDLVTKWKTQIWPQWQNCVNEDLRFRKLTCRNQFDPTDFYAEDVNVPGGRGSASHSLPTFAAVGVRFETGSRSVKDGSKRFAGVDEAGQTDGVITDAGLLVEFNTLMFRLREPISPTLLGIDPIFVPVVVKRIRTGVPGNYQYNFPANQGAMIYSTIVTALYNILITSQVSRKLGVGE